MYFYFLNYRTLHEIKTLMVSFVLLSLGSLANAQQLVDKGATRETIALFNNLKNIANNHTLFGHQHATEYGHGWQGDENRSDVKSVVGSHPAVIGIDLENITGLEENQTRLNKEALRKNVIDTYNRGGITTVSWHFRNPISKGGFYWRDSVSLPAVKYIIPGGKYNDKYKGILREIGEWANSLKVPSGTLVPVIFRPYHELDGDWFWWGKSHCSPEEFKSLWRFTVSYLRDSVGVHNFLYAFSPDSKFNSEAEYLERYPGNDWVDMLGTDNYGDMGRDGVYNLEKAAHKLRIVSELAKSNRKLAAFTETGLESVPHPEWWTDVLLKVIKQPEIKISYVLVWRNDSKSASHFYAPFPGHSSADNFKEFFSDPYTLFEVDLKDLYKCENKGKAF